MKNVLVVTAWGLPDLLKQSPGDSGIWENFRFHISYFGENIDFSVSYDYLIVLYSLPGELTIELPEGNTCFVTQEPPYRDYIILKKLFIYFDNVITQFPVKGRNIIHSLPLVPWQVGKSYDFLIKNNQQDKVAKLSWITSNKSFFPGHKERLRFKKKLDASKIEYDLFGNGFNPIESKWSGLAAYKYSLAIENGCFKHYWTEKIMDCFLSETMPIYYGCPNITDYFPEESMIIIDINNPKETIEAIHRAIKEERWERSLEAIRYSKQLVLNRYQFYPYIASFIDSKGTNNKRRLYKFPANAIKESFIERSIRKIMYR